MRDRLVIDKSLMDMSQLETKLELLVTLMERSGGAVDYQVKQLVDEIVYEYDK